MRLSMFAVSAVLCLSSLAAHADTFYFSYTGQGTDASGTLTGTETTPTSGVYTISSIAGERNGAAITGLNLAFGSPDELLYFPATDTGASLSPTFLDNRGISFDVGSDSYNIFTSGSRPTVVENDGGPAIVLSVSTTAPVAAPEPSSLALLGTGLFGVMGVLRRRFA